VRTASTRTASSRLVRAEWTKLRSLRSSGWTLFAMVVSSIGLGALVCALTAAHWSHVSPADRATWDPTNQSLSGTEFGQLAIAVFGVLAITAEFSSGTIRSSIAAVPRRGRLLAAKVAAYGGVALVVGEVISLVSFFIDQRIFAGRVPNASFGQPGVARAVLLAGVYIAMICMLSLALGAILRHTAGAIAAIVGILLVVPAITLAFPTSLQNSIDKFLPSNLGGASMGAVVPVSHSFGPWVATAILGGYALVALLLAGRLLLRRDV
jgi:hypothetical protein